MLILILISSPLLYGYFVFKLSNWRTQKHISSNSTIISDPKILKMNRCIAKSAKMKILEPKIYEVTPINGLVLPNGEIYITRGLMNCYERGDISVAELTSVIAHEIGHLKLGHTKKRLANFAGQNAARMALGFLFSRYLPLFGNFLAQIIVTLFIKRMSRIDEFAADEFASALLISSGIGTTAQKSLLEKLPKLSNHKNIEITWMMSHPKIKDRIAAIEKLETQWNVNNR